MPTKLRPEHAQKAYELLTAWFAANHPDVLEIPDLIESNKYQGLNLRGQLHEARINFDPFYDNEVIGADHEKHDGVGVNTFGHVKRNEKVNVAKLRQYLPQKEPAMALTLES
jgi:hypothetical protein